MRLDELPEYWQAYGAVSAVIIGGKLERPLRAAQRDALVAWIRSGGTLVVSGIMSRQGVKETFIEDLLPVQLVGLRDLDRLTGLTQRYGGSIVGSGDGRICEAFVADGRTVVGQEELPLIAVRHLGFGAVVYLAFDWRMAAFRDWSGCGAMWEELMGLGYRRPLNVDGSALVHGKDRIGGILSQVVGMRVLCGRAVGASVAAYVATAGLLYFSREDEDRMRELMDKNNKGAMGDEERAEMEAYRRVGNLLGMLQDRAASCWKIKRRRDFGRGWPTARLLLAQRSPPSREPTGTGAGRTAQRRTKRT